MDADTELKYIWLISFLEERKQARRLWNMFCKRKPGPDSDAILGGHGALLSQSLVSLRHLIDAGQLLFAFDGTTVLEGEIA